MMSSWNIKCFVLIFFLSASLQSCGFEKLDEENEVQQLLTSYGGPKLSLPLPPGILWKVNTNPGFRSPEVLFHSGPHFHAIDFGDNFYINGKFFDEGSGQIDVIAAADGTVTKLVDAPACGNGLENNACKVYINHTGKSLGVGYETEYTHLTPGSIVLALGQNVRRGQRIGKMGFSGASSPHLHFQLRFNNDSSQNNPALAGVKLENVPFADYALDRRYPSTNGFTFNQASNNPTLCATAPNGDVVSNWVYTCTPKIGTVGIKDSVWGLMTIENIAHNFAWKAEVVRSGQVVTTYEWEAKEVDPWGWNRSSYWPWVSPDKPGLWEIRYYVRTNDSFPSFPFHILSFNVVDSPPFTYNGNGQLCSKPATGGQETNWVYSCESASTTFSLFTTSTVYGLLYVQNIFKNFKFVTKVYKDNQYLFTDDPVAFTVVEPWKWNYAYAFPQIYRPPLGSWRLEIAIVFADGTPGAKLKDLTFTVIP